MEEIWTSDESDDSLCAADQMPSKNQGSIHSSLYQFILLFLFWKAIFRISASAASFMIRCIKYFVGSLGKAFDCEGIVAISNEIPYSIESIEHMAGLNKQSFVEYVVCPRCDTIYEFKDCIKNLPSGKTEAKTCRHVAYPNHPHRSRRTACGAQLLKKQRNQRSSILVPIKVYPYRSLQTSLSRILSKPGFLEKCESWRQRSTLVPDDTLADVFDGNVWKKFKAETFFDTPHSYLLIMNVDWFQPYKRAIYSTGAIYLTLQNLPRELRYKQENVILVGIIPGPKEPKLTMNSYLTPLVEELKALWNGVLLPVQSNGTILKIRVRAALMAVGVGEAGEA